MICFWIGDIFGLFWCLRCWLFLVLALLGCFGACVVGLFWCLRCWVWGFVLFWLTLCDWSYGEGGFGETQRYSQSLFTSHWKQLKRGQWYFRTFLPDSSNFNTIIRLNTLKTSILNKIDKTKVPDEQLLSQLNEKDSEKGWIKFLLAKINTCILYLK